MRETLNQLVGLFYITARKRRQGWHYNEPLYQRVWLAIQALMIRAYLMPVGTGYDETAGEERPYRRSFMCRILLASVGPVRRLETAERLPGETDDALRHRNRILMWQQLGMEQGDGETDAAFWSRAEAEHEAAQREWRENSEHVIVAFGDDEVECGEIVLSEATMAAVIEQQIVTAYEDDEDFALCYDLSPEQAERIAALEGQPLPAGATHSLQCVRREVTV